MKTLNQLWALGAMTALALMAGCGGESVATQYEPKGEGSIPIGRAVLPHQLESAVQITMSDGRVYNTVTRSQMIFGPCLPKGNTSVVITPLDDDFQPDSFRYVVGTDRYWNFNSHPVESESCLTVRAVEANLVDGQRFHRGQSFDVVARIVGSRYSEVKPTIIVSGGIGRINTVNRVLFTQVGYGKIIIEVCGVKREYRVIVQG